MRPSWVRRLGYVALVLVLAWPLAGAPVDAAAAVAGVPVATTDANTPGSQWLGSCLASGRTLSVLFVLDVSGSLSTTDPKGYRYEGLKTALTTLANTQRPDRSDVVIEAGIAGFGNQYYSTKAIVPWQKINVDSPGPLLDQMVGQARDRTAWRQDGTGFQFVVQPSVDELMSRGGAQSCKAIVWFTDGDPSDPPAVADMCRQGGAVDQMRKNGIVLIGLRLSQNGQPEPSPDMRGMTLGDAGGGNICGTVPIPESHAPGLYLEAQDVKRLFAQIRNITEGCTPTGKLGAHVDPGIRRVRVNMYTDKPVASARFDLPGGISFTAGTSGSSTPPGGHGITVASIRDDYYVSMELTLPPGVGAGDWLVSAAGAPSQDQIEFCVFSDLHLALNPASADDLKAGAAGALVVDVLDANDKPADLSVFGTAAAGVSLIGPDGKPRSASANVDKNGGTIDLLVKTQPTDARLDLQVALTLTTTSGLGLTPLRLDAPVVTALNDYYPKVTPLDELILGDALRDSPVSGEITIVGSAKGPTKVCFAVPESIQVPSDATDADPVYPPGCLQLAPGETRKLTVTASTTTPVEGDGAALIPVEMTAAPDQTGYRGVAGVKLPVTWRFSNPLNIGFLIWGLVLVIALAIILPLLAILWANWATARYDVTNLRWAKIPLLIDSSGIRRVNPIDGSDAIVGRTERLRLPRARKSLLLWGRVLVRSFSVEGVDFRSRTSWNPFRPPRFWAEASDGTILLSSFGAHSGAQRQANSAPFAPAFSAAAVWVARSSSVPPTGPVEGSLLVFETSGGRRESKVHVNSIVVAAAWSASLAAHRPPVAAPSPGQPDGGGALKAPPIRRPRPGTPPHPRRP
jgi:hypothetical protein